MTPSPAPLPPPLPLDGPWRLGRVPPRPLALRGDDRAAVATWLPATVPGNVHADLMRAGLLPNLYVADHVAQASWVDEWDWWLERDLLLALRPGERAFLYLDGVDYLATLWLDDQLLAHHEGAFSRLTVELTPHLRADGMTHTYRLGVRLWGARRWPAPAWPWVDRLLAPVARRLLPGKASLTPYHPRLRLLRPPMQAGWDFAPALPALGLWEGGRVEVTGSVRVVGIRLGSWHFARDGTAEATVQVTLDAPTEREVELGLAWHPVTFDGQGGEQRGVARLQAGQSVLGLPLALPEARRWHPWEQGAPDLYELAATVRVGGVPSARATLRFGARAIACEGRRLTVNGQPFFARGVNWVPCDILPGTVRRGRYERLLGMARARGVNLVRVWGGGGRERRDFYEVCDELGLLVWQEFPFACAFLDRYPRDAAFSRVAEQEARAMVRELRHHPSLALWGAGNEFSARRNRPLVARLAAVVAREDERPFLPPSPSAGERHNWHLWHGLAPLHTLARETTSFLSEFGLQAVPARATLDRFLPPDALWPPGPLWRLHHAELAKLYRYVAEQAGTSGATDLEGLIRASQGVQALGVQLGVERMRRRKGAGAVGVAIWQWNEPWPAISWALVDYFGTPKQAAEGLREWYHPLLLSLVLPTAGLRQGGPQRVALWAINDLASPFPDCEARLYQGEGRLWAAPLDLPPHSARHVADLALLLPDPRAPLRLELWQGTTLLAHNHYPLGMPGPQATPLLSHLYRTLAEWVMRW